MNLPFSLPDWLPGWALLLVALPVLLWVLAFLLMPFSVFGVKSRLEALEGQIESLHEDLRMMAMRASGALPPASRRADVYDEVQNFNELKRFRATAAEEPELAPRRAPIPTPQPMAPPARERLTPMPPSVRARREPKLD